MQEQDIFKKDCPFHAAPPMIPTDWEKVAEDLIKAGPFRSTGTAIVDDGRDP